jgi:hypothetical protein
VDCFDKNYTNVQFNGCLDYFDNKWGIIENDLSEKFSIPEEIEDDTVIIARYSSTQGFLFSKKNIEVYFAAYMPANEVEANLLFISNGSTVWSYSLSIGIPDYPEIPNVRALGTDNDTLKILSEIKGEEDEYYDEIKLNAEIVKVILKLNEAIGSRGLF